MNKFKSFTPLMHEYEYRLLEKYLTPDDILLEYGAGNGTIYFSGLVKKMIAIEHDPYYYDQVNRTIEAFDIKNIDLYLIPGKDVGNGKEERYEKFEEYIDFPIKNKLKFTRVLVDGRARKYCAEKISEVIDENIIVFVHDFNHYDVEGYPDENYFDDILKNYDIVERVTNGRGIVALKKKNYK